MSPIQYYLKLTISDTRENWALRRTEDGALRSVEEDWALRRAEDWALMCAKVGA